MATYNPQDEYDQAKKYAESLNQAVDIGAAPQIQNITGQIQGVQEQFNPYRNAAEVQSRIDAKTLAEQMANTGLTRSGTNLTAQTALTTTKQNTLSGINKAESAARKDLISQLNAYIAQRDAAKQNNLATAQQQAYQNVSEFNRTTALAEINQNYAKENARINQQYNIELTKLQDQLTSAREDKNWLRESELTKQQAELNRQHDIAISNLNAQHAAEQQRIDNEAALARDAANNAAALQRTNVDNAAAYSRAQLSASGSGKSSTDLNSDQRSVISTFGEGYKNGLESGDTTVAQAVAGIGTKYEPGSEAYTLAMGAAGLSKYANDTNYVYSAMNAISGSATSAASALGLQYYGQDLKKDQVAYEISKVYPMGTENFNMALLAAGLSQSQIGSYNTNWTETVGSKGFGR